MRGKIDGIHLSTQNTQVLRNTELQVEINLDILLYIIGGNSWTTRLPLLAKKFHQETKKGQSLRTLKSRIEDTCLLLINSKKDSESGLFEGVVN